MATVLVVDSDFGTRIRLSELLMTQGYEILEQCVENMEYLYGAAALLPDYQSLNHFK
jgi:hypothetical protein